jgi:hypothetical protein
MRLQLAPQIQARSAWGSLALVYRLKTVPNCLEFGTVFISLLSLVENPDKDLWNFPHQREIP